MGHQEFEATKILQWLAGVNNIGADVVYLMANKGNPNKVTTQVAMMMMFGLLSLSLTGD